MEVVGEWVDAAHGAAYNAYRQGDTKLALVRAGGRFDKGVMAERTDEHDEEVAA